MAGGKALMDEAIPTDPIEEVVMPVLRDHGLELVDIEWRPLRPRGVLRLFIDKPGGVGIRDCERVSRELGDVLDAAAMIDASYDLEVSSPGLDRLLRKEREFRWAVGKRLCCWLAGGREVRGRLVAVEPERLVVEDDGERVELPRAGVTKARLEAEVPWTRRA
jgi:ribosome maturation factor RimP